MFDGDYFVAGFDGAGLEDLGEEALLAVLHEGAEAGGDAFHLFAGGAGLDEEEDGGADLDFFAEEREEVDALGFNIGADEAGGEWGEAEGGGVGIDLFARDDCDLTLEGTAGAGAAVEVAFVLKDAFFGDEVEGIEGEHALAVVGWVDVEGGDAGGGGGGGHLARRFVFGEGM